jgi:hypothetical protein
MSHSSDRRTLLIGLGALGAGSLLLPAEALARGVRVQGPLRSILVDVAPMKARGLGSFAERVRVAVVRAMADEFAGRLAPGDRRAPTLNVSVRSVSLSAFGGPSGGRGARGGDTSTDSIDSRLTVSGPGGSNTQPLLVTQAAGGGGGFRFGTENDDAGRIEALARALAHWTRRRTVG